MMTEGVRQNSGGKGHIEGVGANFQRVQVTNSNQEKKHDLISLSTKIANVEIKKIIKKIKRIIHKKIPVILTL